MATAVLPISGQDNGYDITDYLGIHPALGDLGDFAAFMDEAANRGIRVIIDVVVSHTSDQRPWFKAAQTRDPHYFDYYVWRKSKTRIWQWSCLNTATTGSDYGETK